MASSSAQTDVLSLAETLKKSEAHQTTFQHELGYHLQTARDLEAAGYRLQRPIKTVEELDALPIGSAVLSSNNVYLKTLSAWGAAVWGCVGDWNITEPAHILGTDAVVLHEPRP